MRRLSPRIAVILATFSALLLAVRLVASGSPSLAVNMLQAQQCDPKPCWQGVRPGVMTQRQAAGILEARGALPDNFAVGDNHYCWSSMAIPFWRSCTQWLGSTPDTAIERINIEFLANPPRLGDLVLMFGPPVSTELCYVTNSRRSDLPKRFVSAAISFRGDILVIAYQADELSQPRLDPNMIVFRMAYVASDRAESRHWSGFTRLVSGNGFCYLP
jgi:hypothetical protein